MSAATSYGASTIKRIRRTGAQVAQLDAQIIEALKHDHPQSERLIVATSRIQAALTAAGVSHG